MIPRTAAETKLLFRESTSTPINGILLIIKKLTSEKNWLFDLTILINHLWLDKKMILEEIINKLTFTLNLCDTEDNQLLKKQLVAIIEQLQEIDYIQELVSFHKRRNHAL